MFLTQSRKNGEADLDEIWNTVKHRTGIEYEFPVGFSKYFITQWAAEAANKE